MKLAFEGWMACGALAAGGVLLARSLGAWWGARASTELGGRILDLVVIATKWQQPLAPVLARAAGEARGAAKRRLTDVAARLQAGDGLADALHAGAGRCFSEPTLAAVRAAEGGPQLAGVVQRLAVQRDAAQEVRHRALLAAGYPAMVAALLLGFQVLGGRLRPRPDASLPAFEWPHVAIWLVSIAFLAAWLGLALGRFTPQRGWAARVRGLFAERVPVLGPRLTELGVARALDAAGAAIAAGQPLPAALRAAAPAAGAPRLEVGLRTAAVRLAAGADLGAALAGAPLPPAVAVRLAAYQGDRAGLARLCGGLARELRRRLAEGFDAVLGWARPLAVLALGIVVALQLSALLGWLDAVRLRPMERAPW